MSILKVIRRKLAGCCTISTHDTCEIVSINQNHIHSPIRAVDELAVAHKTQFKIIANASKKIFPSKSKESDSVSTNSTKHSASLLNENEESRSQGRKSPVIKRRKRFESSANDVEEVKKMLMAVVREERFSMP